VLTDNGPEFTGRQFTAAMADRGLRHHRIPPRSPNHNAVCERFQGTALQEFYRPAFHRQHFARLADLNAQFQGWLQHYNTRRRNHGDFMRGRTPFAVMEAIYHDHAEGSPVTSTRALEVLDEGEESPQQAILGFPGRVDPSAPTSSPPPFLNNWTGPFGPERTRAIGVGIRSGARASTRTDIIASFVGMPGASTTVH
jgi:Integrase core domain